MIEHGDFYRYFVDKHEGLEFKNLDLTDLQQRPEDFVPKLLIENPMMTEDELTSKLNFGLDQNEIGNILHVINNLIYCFNERKDIVIKK